MSDTLLPPVDLPEGELAAAHFPPDRPKEPAVRAPIGACDTHVHVVAGPDGFPRSEGHSENPPLHGFEEWLGLYRSHLDILGCTRGVIVQSILYGADNSLTVEALRRLGNGFRGIGLMTSDIPDEALDHLAAHRIRGVQVDLVHGGVLGWGDACSLAPRLAQRGMHIEVMLHADRHLDAIASGLDGLLVPLVVDHAGWPSDGRSDGPGPRRLCALLGEGRVWVKLSGVYRFSDPPYAQAERLVAALVAANPERCLWGSDWPHLMRGGRQMPDAGVLFDLFTRVVDDSAVRQQVLVNGPAELYGF